MAVTVEMENTGDPGLQREVVAVIENVDPLLAREIVGELQSPSYK